jgi:AGCS family alanine or glycine:cation symporter
VDFVRNGRSVPLFNGQLEIIEGEISTPVTLITSRSVAEDMFISDSNKPFTGSIQVVNGKWQPSSSVAITGKSLLHSAPLTAEAFKRSILGDWGQYVVSIGLLLFAFSTAISWSYYGDRALTFMVGPKYVIYYRIIFVITFFIASFTDTTIIWSLSYITIAFMTVPNLIGLWILRKEIKSTIAEYWAGFSVRHPDDRMSKRYMKNGKL